MNLTLTRIFMSNDRGTFGVLSEEEYPLCVTIELPWLDNAHDISCIPEGEYKFKRHDGAKWKHVWEILDVPDRENILIHAGNSMHDVLGCIAVGTSFFTNGILQSQQMLDKLRKTLPDEGTITIKNCFVL